MTTLVARLRDAQEVLNALARRHGVPGAALAIAKEDELLDFATGVLNVDTGVDTTTDSVFQIGSNTKVVTTTLIMQLVDAGKVDLDAPVKRYLKRFALKDPTAASEITVRQLLTHTSGIQGDYFVGFGRGEDSIGRYVDSLSGIDLVHRPGQMWSYCNSAFVVAGRLAEVLTGSSYHQLMQEKICQPLGLTHTTVQVEDMIARRCAVGHIAGPGGKLLVPPTVVMEYAHAPAGSLTVSTAAELVRFVQLHLNGGVAPDASPILSADSVQAMQQTQAPMPDTSAVPDTMGLGWMLSEWDGRRVIGHGGGTIGQLSFLQALPDDGLVVALFTNSEGGRLLWRDLARWLFDELAGVHFPTPLKPTEPPPKLNLSRYVGTYERLGFRYSLNVEDGQLTMRSEMTDEVPPELRGPESPPVRLRPVDQERFVANVGGVDTVVAFLQFDRGKPGYLFIGRAAQRAADRPSGPTRHGRRQAGETATRKATAQSITRKAASKTAATAKRPAVKN
jgi:CubicO group peptidase (beta-lactamase class C family)